MLTRLKPISEQTIVITGASSGVGLATARGAVSRSARVVLVARNGAALERIAAELRADGGDVAICAVDVSADGAPEAIAHTAVDVFGGFDTWVNCAAVSDYGTLEQIGLAEHRRVFDVNYFAMLQCSLLAVRHLRERGGAIVNLGSILSDRAIIEQAPYSASKHAVLALTANLRMDVERQRLPISVTLIKPGGIHTPFPEHARNHMEAPPRAAGHLRSAPRRRRHPVRVRASPTPDLCRRGRVPPVAAGPHVPANDRPYHGARLRSRPAVTSRSRRCGDAR